MPDYASSSKRITEFYENFFSLKNPFDLIELIRTNYMIHEVIMIPKNEINTKQLYYAPYENQKIPIESFSYKKPDVVDFRSMRYDFFKKLKDLLQQYESDISLSNLEKLDELNTCSRDLKDLIQIARLPELYSLFDTIKFQIKTEDEGHVKVSLFQSLVVSEELWQKLVDDINILIDFFIAAQDQVIKSIDKIEKGFETNPELTAKKEKVKYLVYEFVACLNEENLIDMKGSQIIKLEDALLKIFHIQGIKRSSILGRINARTTMTASGLYELSKKLGLKKLPTTFPNK